MAELNTLTSITLTGSLDWLTLELDVLYKDLITVTTPILKKSKLALLLLLILPLTAQAEFCEQGRLPNLADTMKTVDILDADFSYW